MQEYSIITKIYYLIARVQYAIILLGKLVNHYTIQSFLLRNVSSKTNQLYETWKCIECQIYLNQGDFSKNSFVENIFDEKLIKVMKQCKPIEAAHGHWKINCAFFCVSNLDEVKLISI